MTESTPEAQATDTSAEAPQEGAPRIEFADDVDTPTPEPGGESQGEVAATPAPQTFSFAGKEYPSLAEAEKAHVEAQQRMHQATEEASVYRKTLENLPNSIPGQQAQPNPEALNDQFRDYAEKDLLGAFSFVAKQVYDKEQAETMQQRTEVMQAYTQFAADPQFADVAPTVAQRLTLEPNMDVEKAFLHAKVQAMQASAAAPRVSSTPQAPRMQVETPGSRQPDNTFRVEVAPGAQKVRNAFRDLSTPEEWENLNIRAARVKSAGLTGPEGKSPVSIDEWQRLGGDK